MKKTSESARIAVIGAGMMGQRHIGFMQQIPSASLVAVVDPATESATIANQNNVPWFTDTATMFHEVKPQGIIVASPTIYHLRPVVEALARGVHVLIEKPVTATLSEADTIRQYAADSTSRILVGHHRRHNPIVSRTREIISGGVIGDLRAVNGQWTVLKHPDYFTPDWRKDREAGPVLINLVHEIDYLLDICGPIHSISAEMSSHARQFDKEDTAAVIIGFENGALGTFLISDACPSPWSWENGTAENPLFPGTGQNAIRFMGSDGALEFPNLRLWSYAEGHSHWHHPIDCTEMDFNDEDAFLIQCEHFCQVVLGNQAPMVTLNDGIDTLRSTLAVFEAAESGSRQILR